MYVEIGSVPCRSLLGCDCLCQIIKQGAVKSCPTEGFRGQALTQTAMQVHFFHRHVQDTVIIIREGNLHHPWCPGAT